MTRIRVATAADAERIAEITVAAARAFGPDAYTDEQVETWAEPGEPPTPEDADHWVVAERDGRVVGWGRFDVDGGEITGNYVDPDHARAGVGAAIVAALEGYARGQGRDEVVLAASKNAVGFYDRLGYEGCGEVEHGTDAVVIECLEMRKAL